MPPHLEGTAMDTPARVLQQVSGGIGFVMLSLILALAGCEETERERVLDVEAPGVDVEVDRVDEGDGDERLEIEAGEVES